VVLSIVALEPLHDTYSMSRAQASRGVEVGPGGSTRQKRLDQQQRESPDQPTMYPNPPTLPLSQTRTVLRGHPVPLRSLWSAMDG
jgi:hypothetical protein